MQRRGIPVLLLVVALAAAGEGASAQQPGQGASLFSVLSQRAPLFGKLLETAKVGPASVSASTVGTFFAPSDAAIKDVLKSMGYSEKELLAMPVLADLMTSYHLIPGQQVSAAELAKGPKVAATGDDNFIVRLSTGAGGSLAVSDVQGNTATVTGGPFTANKLSVYVIDRVLLSGNYFASVDAALKHYPFWSTAAELVARAGLSSTLSAAGGSYTMLLPGNAGFKPVEASLAAANTSQLGELLRFHVLPGGLRNVPRGFKDGRLPTLLTGQSVDVKVVPDQQGYNPFTRKPGAKPLLTVTPQTSKPGAAKPSTVVLYNVYAGRSILQGIDRVLLPDVPLPPPASPPPLDDANADGGAAPVPAVAPSAAATAIKVLASGGVGAYQTFANGVTGDNTARALAAAAGPGGAAPLQYVSRFGSLGAAGAASGCLNCAAWAKGS